MGSLPQRNLQNLAAEQEKQLQQQRRDFTVELRLRKGPFWQEISAIRERWNIRPIRAVPSQDHLCHWFGVSLHLPLHMFPTKDELASADDWTSVYRRILADLSSWEDNLRSAYQRLVSPDQRRTDRLMPGTFEQFAALPRIEGLKSAGDKYTVHWAPFLSGCALFDPPQNPDDLAAFADQIRWYPATLVLSERDRQKGKPPRVEPPGVRYMANLEEHVRALEDEQSELLARLALRPELRGHDFLGMVTEERKQMLSRPVDPPPVEAMLDPRTAANRGILWSARRVVTSNLPGAGAPEKYDDLDALRFAELREQGLKMPEIARRMSLPLQRNDHGELRRSKSAQDLRRRAEKLIDGD